MVIKFDKLIDRYMPTDKGWFFHPEHTVQLSTTEENGRLVVDEGLDMPGKDYSQLMFTSSSIAGDSRVYYLNILSTKDDGALPEIVKDLDASNAKAIRLAPETTMVFRTNYPYNKDRVKKVLSRVRKEAGTTATIHIGVCGIRDEKYIQPDGSAGYDTFYEMVISGDSTENNGFVVGETYDTHLGYILGTDTAENIASATRPNNDVDYPAALLNGTTDIALVIKVSDGEGFFYVDSIELQDTESGITALSGGKVLRTEVSELMDEVDGFSNDGKITTQEKRSLITIITEIDTEYGEENATITSGVYGLYAAARDAEVASGDLTTFSSVYTTLSTEIHTILSEAGTSTIDRTVFNGWFAAYFSSRIFIEQETAAKVAAAIDSEIDTLTSEIETFSADSSITALEKRSLVTLIAEIKAEYGTQTAVVGDANYGVYAAARDAGVDETITLPAFHSVYTTLVDGVDAIIAADSPTTVVRATFNGWFTAYYSKKISIELETSNLITAGLEDEIDGLQTTLDTILADGKITTSEKLLLGPMMQEIKDEYGSEATGGSPRGIYAAGVQAGVPVATIKAKYDALITATDLILAETGTSAIDKVVFNAYFAAYYAAKAIVTQEISRILTSSLSLSAETNIISVSGRGELLTSDIVLTVEATNIELEDITWSRTDSSEKILNPFPLDLSRRVLDCSTVTVDFLDIIVTASLGSVEYSAFVPISKVVQKYTPPYNFGGQIEEPRATPTGARLVVGDFFLASSSFSDVLSGNSYTLGEAYVYTGGNWARTEDSVILLDLMSDFVALTEDTPDVIASKLIAKKVYAQSAVIETIGASQITLKDPGLIKSSNFVSGESGFQLRSDGTFEAADVVFRGTGTFEGKMTNTVFETQEATSNTPIAITTPNTHWYMPEISSPWGSTGGTYRGKAFKQLGYTSNNKATLATPNLSTYSADIPYTNIYTVPCEGLIIDYKVYASRKHEYNYPDYSVNTIRKGTKTWLYANGAQIEYVECYNPPQSYNNQDSVSVSKTVYPAAGTTYSGKILKEYSAKDAWGGISLTVFKEFGANGMFIWYEDNTFELIDRNSYLTQRLIVHDSAGDPYWDSNDHIKYRPATDVYNVLSSLPLGIEVYANPEETHTFTLNDESFTNLISVVVNSSSVVVRVGEDNRTFLRREWYTALAISLTPLSNKAAILTDALVPITSTPDIGEPENPYGYIWANAFNSISKRIYKENITPFTENALALISSIDVVSFNFKIDKEKTYNIGFIADDTHEFFAGKEHNRMALSNSVGILFKAVQELTVKNKQLEQRLDNVQYSLPRRIWMKLFGRRS